MSCRLPRRRRGFEAGFRVLSPLGRDADERLERTLDWWQSWTNGCTYEGSYKQAVLRNALTLKLLSFLLSGSCPSVLSA